MHGLNQRLAAMSSRIPLARAADALMSAVQVLLARFPQVAGPG
jgi:hypothetical protein